MMLIRAFLPTLCLNNVELCPPCKQRYNLLFVKVWIIAKICKIVIVQITWLEFYTGGSDTVIMSRLSSACRIFRIQISAIGGAHSVTGGEENMWRMYGAQMILSSVSKLETKQEEAWCYSTGRDSFWCRRPSLIKQDGYPCWILCCDWSVSYHHQRSGF